MTARACAVTGRWQFQVSESELETDARRIEVTIHGFVWRNRQVVRREGEGSNTAQELFDTLSDWENQLKHSELASLDMEPGP